METKICNKCLVDKQFTDFPKNKCGKYGLHSSCKLCKNNTKKIWRSLNAVFINIKGKNYSRKNAEKIRKRKKSFYQKNKKKYCDRMKRWYKKYPHIRSWRGLVPMTLNKLGGIKEGKTIDILGYSALELKIHIEGLFTDGMTWNNYGEWHIDHIKQIITFDVGTHPSIVNAFSNLRPLWATTREINGIMYEGNLNRFKYR